MRIHRRKPQIHKSGSAAAVELATHRRREPRALLCQGVAECSVGDEAITPATTQPLILQSIELYSVCMRGHGIIYVN